MKLSRAVPLFALVLAAAALSRPVGAQSAPCSLNKELEAAALRLTFTPDGGAPLNFRFRFASCRAESTDRVGNPITPQAVRAYFDSAAGYGLSVTTIGGGAKSDVTLVQNVDSGYMVAGTFGEHGNGSLSTGTIDLGPVSIADFRGTAKITHGRATLKGERP